MSKFGRQQLEEALTALGQLLAARGEHFEVVLIGGGNLILRELVSRPTTKDLDIIGEFRLGAVERLSPMPASLKLAVEDVGRAFGLAREWLNLEPASLLDFGLPDGLPDRLERRDFGGLVVWLAGWYDMVCFKLFAVVGQGPQSRHFEDLRELNADRETLVAAARWAITHDSSPGFRMNLLTALNALAVVVADDELG